MRRKTLLPVAAAALLPKPLPTLRMSFAPGEEVWAHTGSDEVAFERGLVDSLLPGKGAVVVRIKRGRETAVVEVKEAEVHRTNKADQDGADDNTYLRELNEATLLHNVRHRYNSSDDAGCYSSTGHILIAVNPFRELTIYSEAQARARSATPPGRTARLRRAASLAHKPARGAAPCEHGRLWAP